jgi:hypothetical protein
MHQTAGTTRVPIPHLYRHPVLSRQRTLSFTTMKRPFGVLVAAFALGLFAAGVLLFSGLMLFGGVAMLHPQHTLYGALQPAPRVLFAIVALTALLFAGVAVWAVITLVGLLRLRNWARYSITGGLLAGLGLISILGILVLPTANPAATPGLPLPSPGLMQAMRAVIALFYAGIAAVGAWWLVYFNLRSVKSFFLPNYRDTRDAGSFPGGMYASHAVLAYPGAAANGPRGSSYAASLAAPGGLPGWTAPPPPPFAAAPYGMVPRPGRFSAVPVPVLIIAILLMIGSFFCLLLASIPLPAFALGFILNGWPRAILYLALGILSGFTGWGLLRLDERARVAAFFLDALFLLNLAATFTPFYWRGFLAYQATLNARMHLPVPPVMFPHASLEIMSIPAIALYGALLWILIHYRAAFRRPKPGN